MRHTQYGLTFIELIIALAIAAIVGVFSAPGFVSILEKKTADSTAYSILHGFQQARSHAITNRGVVKICGSDDGLSCQKQWSKFLIIFNDENDDDVIDTGEIINQVNLDLDTSTILTKVSLGKSYIELKPDGTPKQWGNFIYCPNDKSDKKLLRRVTWNRIGRPYYGKDINGDGVVEATNGKALSC